MKTFFLALLALLAFAGNSILCRLALSAGAIDAGSFTLIRLAAGIVTLFGLCLIANLMSAVVNDRDKNQRGSSSHGSSLHGSGLRASKLHASKGSWLGGVSLFLYAAFFSYAYISLDTATGALILFGTVQIALILFGIVKGQRPSVLEYIGFITACFGFAYLLWPELSKPSVLGLCFMVIAGLAWAVYTVQGQGSKDPLSDTAYNFFRTTPLLIVLLAFMLFGVFGDFNITAGGVMLAIASGALTSGVGYALWYAALANMKNTTAAVSQLSVPVFAALFGLLFANEAISPRLLISAALVLGGILLVILVKPRVKTAAKLN